MLFVVGVSLQHVILRDQTLRAFGEEYLVAELDGRLHLAALDQVRMGFENGIDFLGGRNLLTIEHPTAPWSMTRLPRPQKCSISLRSSSAAMSAIGSLPRAF